jgi:putative transposase
VGWVAWASRFGLARGKGQNHAQHGQLQSQSPMPPAWAGLHGQAALGLPVGPHWNHISPPAPQGLPNRASFRYSPPVWLPDGRVRKLRECHNVRFGVHEVTFSCHCGFRMLNHDRTRQWFVEALERARRLHHLKLRAYVIMPEHVHILLRVDQENYHLADVLKSIKQSVARKAIARLRGHAPAALERLKVVRPGGRTEYRFWTQGGGYDRNLWSAEAIASSVRYIHRNPVRRGLAARPEDWRWSSAAWYLGADDVPLKMDWGRSK